MPDLRAALAVLALALASTTHAAEVRATLGRVEVVAWTPAQAAGPAPVAVFSHGLGMCPTQARFLTTALAAAGYLVVAPYHADSACDFGFDVVNPARVPLKPANLWTDADYRDRADDLLRVVAALRDGAVAGVRADAERIALLGHSLGGYTVLGLAGAWPAWPAPEGLRAVVAMSPYALPFFARGALERLRVPVMFQSGTGDVAFGLPVALGGGAYARAPAPKVLVEIGYGTHFAWTDAGVFGREPIVATTLAFLDHHVRDLPEREPLLAAIDGVARLQREPPAAVPVALATGAAVPAGGFAWSTMRDWWRGLVDFAVR